MATRRVCLTALGLALATSKVFYTDEDAQQSLPFILDVDRVKLFQDQILEILGLHKPQGIGQLDDFVSGFMSSLFRVADCGGCELKREFALDSEALQTDVKLSDTVISFIPSQFSFQEVDAAECFEVKFEGIEIPEGALTSARFYVVMEEEMDTDLMVELFEQIGSDLKLVATSDLSFDGVRTFTALNITELFSGWLAANQSSRTLVLQVRTADGEYVPFSGLKVVHTFGVGFFVDTPEVDQRNRVRRHAGLENQPDLSRRTVTDDQLLSHTDHHDVGGNRCSLRSLYVDFKDLGWNTWVIAPSGYQADYCDGQCGFPLDGSLSPTNHAVVQTLVHLLDKKRAVRSKCAPTEMREQSILFLNNQNNLVMKRYQNMRVQRCGCR